jgi:hypothetical protein
MTKIPLNELNKILSEHLHKPIEITGFYSGRIGFEEHTELYVGDTFSLEVE